MVHVLPRLPPAADGVGDYVTRLREFWPQGEPNWSYVVRSEAMPSRLLWPGRQIEECGTSSARLLAALEKIETSTVALHYVSYGFHPRGCPFWLAHALKQWKQQSSIRRVVVMFHEFYALTPVWQSAFWLRPLAKAAIANLIRIADRCLTSCPDYQERLLREFKADPDKVRMIPIGANIIRADQNLPSRPWPLNENGKLRVVVFGLGLTRIWALRAHAQLLRTLFQRNLLESITLLGKGGLNARWTVQLAHLKASIAPDSIWRESYDLSSTQLSNSLSEYDLGMVSNWPGILTKSGVFAALSAHGILSVIAQRKGGENSHPYPDAFFVSNDQPAPIEACLKELLNPSLIAKKRHNLNVFYREYLSWNHITRQWSDALAGL